MGNVANFCGQHGQIRDIEVTLQASWDIADLLVGGFKQRPHWVDDLGAVRINQQTIRLDVMPGNMDVAGALKWQGRHEGKGDQN